jgi:transposase
MTDEHLAQAGQDVAPSKFYGLAALSRLRVTSGWVPEEDSSGERRRLGHISKQGNSLLRFLLVEAAQVTVRSHQEWRSKFFHLAMRRGRKIAKVAMARRLAIRLYWMWRKRWNYEQLTKFGAHAGQPGNPQGVR